MLVDGGDPPLCDGDIADRRKTVPGIDDVAALKQEVVSRLRGGAENGE